MNQLDNAGAARGMIQRAYISHTEIALLCLLFAYAVAFIILGWKYKNYLWNYERKKGDQDFSLAMAGLSVTAIALILAIEYSRIILFTPIILFFSISLVTIMLSWFVDRYQLEWFQMGFLSFVSNVLVNTGILSLIGGFLEFFNGNLPKNQPIARLPIDWALGIFILGVLVLSFVDLFKQTKLWDRLKSRIVVVIIIITFLVIGLLISFGVNWWAIGSFSVAVLFVLSAYACHYSHSNKKART